MPLNEQTQLGTCETVRWNRSFKVVEALVYVPIIVSPDWMGVRVFRRWKGRLTNGWRGACYSLAGASAPGCGPSGMTVIPVAGHRRGRSTGHPGPLP